MKPVMMYIAAKYHVFTDETKYKQALTLITANNQPPYYNVVIDEVPALVGWKLHITGMRGDGANFVDPKNTATALIPNFDTLEDALTYVEDTYKPFIEDAGLATLFEKKVFNKTKGYASFYGNLYPVIK